MYCVNLTPRGGFFVMLKKLKLQGPALAPASSRSALGGLGLTKAVSPWTIMESRWRRRGRDRNIFVRESPPKNLWLLLSFGHMSFKHIFQKCIIESGKHLFSNRKNNYRFLPLSESWNYYHLAFTQDLHLTHWKKSKDYIHFYEKRHNVKIAVSTALRWAVIEVAHTRSSENSARKTLPWELHSASQPQAAIALNCVTICALSQFILCIH